MISNRLSEYRIILDNLKKELALVPDWARRRYLQTPSPCGDPSCQCHRGNPYVTRSESSAYRAGVLEGRRQVIEEISKSEGS
jgi:hypothetical protein